MKARVGSVSPVLFKDGEGCGACYKVKCLDHAICSRRAATVIVTDECPGGLCAFGRTHFDLSGAAFSRMAVAGAGGHLRDRGEISVVYRRLGPLPSPNPCCCSLPWLFCSVKNRLLQSSEQLDSRVKTALAQK